MSLNLVSFQNAFNGLVTASSTQLNLRVHLSVATLVSLLSIWLKVSLQEGITLLLAIALVLVAELVNTALEYLSNAVTIEHNEHIGHAKDISAGAVLVAAACSVAIGLLIFVPKLLLSVTKF